MQLERKLDRSAAGLLRQQHDLHAVGEREALRAEIEIRRCRVEAFPGGYGRIALVVLHQRGDVELCLHRRALRLRVWNELADSAIRGLQVRDRDALHVGRADLAPAVAFEEEEPPVAAGHRFRDRGRECLRARDDALEVVQRPSAYAFDLDGGDRLRLDAFERGDHRVACLVARTAGGNLREEHRDARIVHAPVLALDRGGEIRVDQSLVESAGRRAGHDFGERIHRHVVGARLRHGVIKRADELRIANAAQHDLPLAVLHRLVGV